MKKSRVSLRVKRTVLKHEGRILQLLQGHPSIPEVYAHGRLEHFEYLSMELLGRCVGDLYRGSNGLPGRTVFLITKDIVGKLKSWRCSHWLDGLVLVLHFDAHT